MKELKNTLWDRHVKIQKEKAMDHRGFIPCKVCETKVFYDDIELKVYYKKRFEFYFVEKNNYFCCKDCEVDKEQKREVASQFSKLPPVEYNEDDLKLAIAKLDRILTNIAWHRIRIQD